MSAYYMPGIYISYLVLTGILGRRYYYYLHLIDNDTEIYRG